MMKKFEAKIKVMQESENRDASSEALLAFPDSVGRTQGTEGHS